MPAYEANFDLDEKSSEASRCLTTVCLLIWDSEYRWEPGSLRECHKRRVQERCELCEAL